MMLRKIEFYFSIKEFLIDPLMRDEIKPIPLSVIDKIYKYHIYPLNEIRELLGKPIIVSAFSGYRPQWWEIENNRKGKSQHTFTGRGAVDITCADMPKLLVLLKRSAYNRIAYYAQKNTFHCDYYGEGRFYFEVKKNKWIKKEELV